MNPLKQQAKVLKRINQLRVQQKQPNAYTKERQAKIQELWKSIGY